MNHFIKENNEKSATFYFSRLKPHIALIVANIVWGSSFLFTKLLLVSLPPVTISVCRFFLASIFLYFYIKLVKKEKIAFDKRGSLPLILLGLFGITIYFYMENSSLLYISVTSTSLIIALIPAITYLISIFVLRERIRFVNIIGVMIAFIGAALVILKRTGLSNLSRINLGYALAIIATLSFAIYAVLGKKTVMKYTSIQTTFFTFLFGSILSIPLLYFEIEGIVDAKLSISVAFNVIYLTLVCSILSYFLWNWGLKRIGPGKATIYMNLIPLTATLLGWIYLNEDITNKVVLGGILILIGVYITNKK